METSASRWNARDRPSSLKAERAVSVVFGLNLLQRVAERAILWALPSGKWVDATSVENRQDSNNRLTSQEAQIRSEYFLTVWTTSPVVKEQLPTNGNDVHVFRLISPFAHTLTRKKHYPLQLAALLQMNHAHVGFRT